VFDLLRGLKVVDLTTIVLGPYATQLLGDFGADVIKVEPPEGDLFRSARPGRSAAMGAPFLNCNRNKRSIVLDLARAEGLVALRRLLTTADVVVHNMRPEAARRLGVSYEAVREIQPEIVYCYGCGFGQEGQRAGDPAYDDIIQAASGLAVLNAAASGEPRYLPTLLADKVAGLHLALAVAAGVAGRARTGRGSCIEVPMFESVVSFLMVDVLAGRTFEPPLGAMGYGRLTSPFRKPFATRDGFIAILPYSGEHWARFLALIDRTDLAASDLVTDPVQRSQQIDRLYAVIEEVAPTRTTAEWLALLRAHDIPCGTVTDPNDLPDDTHMVDVGMFVPVDHPTEGSLIAARSPFRLSIGGERDDLPVPSPGEHGEAILRESGFTAAEIERLVRAGGVQLPHPPTGPYTRTDR